MKTFKYCKTHLDDEAYMKLMCSKGYAARRLVEGFWTFEECNKNEYCYKMMYFRGKSKGEVEEIKAKLKEKDIEFVSSYSFWAIFRSKKEFEIYNQKEEITICKKIYQPMPYGVIISLAFSIIMLILALKVNMLFLILFILALVYGLVCLYLATGYHSLIKRLEN